MKIFLQNVNSCLKWQIIYQSESQYFIYTAVTLCIFLAAFMTHTVSNGMVRPPPYPGRYFYTGWHVVSPRLSTLSLFVVISPYFLTEFYT